MWRRGTTKGMGSTENRVGVDQHTDQESKVIQLLTQEYSEPGQIAYLIDRVALRLALTHQTSRTARNYFYAARIAVIASGVLLPAAVTTLSQSHGTAHTWLSICAIALSLLLAVASGILQMTKIDQQRRLNHWAWIELRNEAWALAQRRGAYTDPSPSTRFGAFVDRVESLLQRFESGVLTILAGVNSDQDPDPSPDSVDPLPN
jgi:hypothetical protein